MPQKPVRTYLDPDAVGPLPRAVIADDSDAMAAARTIVRLPPASTQEIVASDFIEDAPRHQPSSLSPVGYEPSLVGAARRPLTAFVAAAVGAAAVLGIAAIVKGVSSADEPQAPPSYAAAAALPPPAPSPQVVIPVVTTASPVPAPLASTGTLRVDGAAEGRRIYVDGVVLSAAAAVLACGPHDVAVGSATRPRTIDVPCGGEVTVFR